MGPLQRALSCVSTAVLVRGQGSRSGLRSVTAVPLLTSKHSLYRFELSILHEFAVEGSGQAWEARTTSYWYEISHAGGPMVLAFHWHPEGLSRVTMPHLHVGGPIQGVDLAKAHVPAGIITLAGVVAFLITDLGVRPSRDDWRTVLVAESHG